MAKGVELVPTCKYFYSVSVHTDNMWYTSWMFSTIANDFRLAISRLHGERNADLITNQISQDLLKKKEKLQLH